MPLGSELAHFQQQLLGWFRQFQRDLPWRTARGAYRVWVSEIMLQQTRVAAVIPYYQRFLERFPDVYALAEAPEAELLRLWSGLGYYRRARHLQRAARQIVAQHKGEFPRKLPDALALPGIGAYTAAAILSIAYGAPLAVLDGNVARVLARLFAMDGDLRQGPRWRALEEQAAALLDRREPGNWNQAMMELGATLCTPRSPQCLLCPVATFCEARRLGIVEVLPEKRKKREAVRVTLAAAVFVDRKGKTLLLAPPQKSADRRPADHLPALVSGMWHFPTIVVVENPELELLESLHTQGVAPLELVALPLVRHAVTYRDIRIVPFGVPCAKLPRFPRAKPLPLGDLSALPISNLTRKVARSALAAAHRRPSAGRKGSLTRPIGLSPKLSLYPGSP
jgi:A/G-specific adenine glycosylase